MSRPEVARLSGANVRFGSKADIGAPGSNVRFTPESGHGWRTLNVRFLPIADIEPPHSITSAEREHWRDGEPNTLSLDDFVRARQKS